VHVDPHSLGELERQVLEHLFRVGRADAKEVQADLGKRRGITLNTIQSTLKRLFEKGLLGRVKVSHAHVYVPALSREQFERGALDRTVERVLGGRPDAMVAAFVDLTERAGSEHLAKLEALVAARRKEISRR
jgi:predicted transcriptional regulator